MRGSNCIMEMVLLGMAKLCSTGSGVSSGSGGGGGVTGSGDSKIVNVVGVAAAAVVKSHKGQWRDGDYLLLQFAWKFLGNSLLERVLQFR